MKAKDKGKCQDGGSSYKTEETSMERPFIDLTPEFERTLDRLRAEFANCNNIANFLLAHQKLSQIFTRKLQMMLDKIPELTNKQISEININAGPGVMDLVKALEKNNLELKEKEA